MKETFQSYAIQNARSQKAIYNSPLYPDPPLTLDINLHSFTIFIGYFHANGRKRVFR